MRQPPRKPRPPARPPASRAPAAPRAPRYAANVEVLLVGKADAAKPLQDFLAARLGLSRRAAKAIIDGRSVWVNRRCVWIAHHALKTGDAVEIPRAVISAAKRQKGSDVSQKQMAVRSGESAASPTGTPRGSDTLVAFRERRHVRVLAQTDYYVIADKPAGVVSCGDPRSVEAILRAQLNEPTLQAVHRLDRDTTGCLLFAKNYQAYLAAVEVFKTHRVAKVYYAIVAGRFEHAHFTVDAPLDGERALSHVSREAAGPDASFLRVRIETGRTNQIRRHLAGIRYPVLGDRTFGLKSARDPRLMAVPRQMLHAATLTLPDPMVKGGEIKAHSPLPADFRSTLKLFGMGKR